MIVSQRVYLQLSVLTYMKVVLIMLKVVSSRQKIK